MRRKDSTEVLLAKLRDDLRAARGLSTERLAAQIQEIGFQCLRCGDCCTGEDNSVVVFPFEIRRILGATAMDWSDVVEPPQEGEWDSEGIFHTLEWRLKREDGSCKFYAKCNCKIYGSRPLLCSTYPFYLDSGALRCSECRGLGRKIRPGEAWKIAALLKKRWIIEICEAIALLERYEDFERGRPGKRGLCVVHDSEGEHRVITELHS
ncbi:MAG: YkgJ family cysteine cluster protein [Methanothrix sp.]|nr:YkgJ family cysteine cluster protein [Methanothrix sp.]